jgi:hypothetical protein
MLVLPARSIALAAATGLAACASGHGAAFNSQSGSAGQQASRDPQRSLQDGGVNGLAGSRSRDSGGAPGGTRRGSGGRNLYASGNVVLPGGAAAPGAHVSAGLGGTRTAASVKAGGMKLAVKADPLGGQAAKVKAGGASVSIGSPVAGLKVGKTVKGAAGAATGVASAAGKTAGSLIGSGAKGADGGVKGVVGGVLGGGKHKKPGG